MFVKPNMIHTGVTSRNKFYCKITSFALAPSVITIDSSLMKYSLRIVFGSIQNRESKCLKSQVGLGQSNGRGKKGQFVLFICGYGVIPLQSRKGDLVASVHCSV